jgi:hypothetical protein
MRIIYDPTVDALTIRLVEERVGCEVVQGVSLENLKVAP